ncbi:hypothetical protein RESH_02650 [Rhodopirellula europaea SH398]|uniref:Uncharacterized protein n=2 Tax=Rhodopirellula europaea TaxID=1263866 RepID=M2A3C9_9BACT|nr:hypothetical protein RE6C_05714 [Rhodopirellula europaea 6C]EMI26757.1 hypothetical protein RESH_02650 [Rhodopirellula europaea SH398]
MAFSRKQIRHKPNLRYTERGRPQNLQRFSFRVENLGVRSALATLDLLATKGPAVYGSGSVSSERHVTN